MVQPLHQVVERSRVDLRPTNRRGNGLFAVQTIPLSGVILSVNRSLTAALDTPRLTDTCYECLEWEMRHGFMTGPLRNEQKSSENKVLKACTGCDVAKYCSKGCQTLSWNSYHKYECKIFAKLRPNILPSSVRAIVRLLLVHKAKRIPVGEWDQFIALTGHVSEIREQRGERLENLWLMTKAAMEYSGTDLEEDVVLGLFCRLLINSFTLTTPTFDPLGIAVHPLPALINHSCRPNAFVRFTKEGRLDILPLHQIEKDSEILISYVDATDPHHVRSLELRSRYFFDCNCGICRLGDEGTNEDFLFEPSGIEKRELMATETQVVELLQSAQKDTNFSNPILKLKYGLYVLHQTTAWPDSRYPFPVLRHQLMLTYIDAEQYNSAFVYAAMQYFLVDPKIYKKEHYPTRTVHGWVLLRLIEHVMEHKEWASQELDLCKYELGLDFWKKHVIWKLHTTSQKVAGGFASLNNMISKKYDEARGANRYWISQVTFSQEASDKEHYECERKKLGQLIEDVVEQEKTKFDITAA